MQINAGVLTDVSFYDNPGVKERREGGNNAAGLPEIRENHTGKKKNVKIWIV